MALPPELMSQLIEAVIGLIGVLVLIITYYLRQLAQTQTAIKTQVTANATQECGSLMLTEDEYQSAAGMEAMFKALPSGHSIDKVVEGVASNGSKYRIVYWTVKR